MGSIYAGWGLSPACICGSYNTLSVWRWVYYSRDGLSTVQPPLWCEKLIVNSRRDVSVCPGEAVLGSEISEGGHGMGSRNGTGLSPDERGIPLKLWVLGCLPRTGAVLPFTYRDGRHEDTPDQSVS